MTAEDIALNMEIDLYKALGRYLKGEPDLDAGWKLAKLGQMQALSKEVREVIDDYVPAMETAGGAQIEEAMHSHLAGIDKDFKQAGFPPAPAPLSAAIEESIQGLSKSTAVKLQDMGETLVRTVPRVYEDIIVRAANEAALGAVSSQEALEKTMRQWTDKGLPAMVDKVGRTWAADTYSRMFIRTQTRSGVTQLTMERSKQYGNDLIEIDSHAGARPGCEPYQGQVFSLSGRTEGYSSLSSTSYGEPDGIFGINCRHNMYPYFPGKSEKTYEPGKKRENERIYQESQRQRQLESRIRNSKKELAFFDSQGGDSTKAAKTLQQRENALQSFLQSTGRRRRGDLEMIYN